MGDMADWAEMQAFEEMFREEYEKENDEKTSEEYKRLFALHKLEWKPKEGSPIVIQQMEKYHIENCIKFLQNIQELEPTKRRAALIEIFNYELASRNKHL